MSYTELIRGKFRKIIPQEGESLEDLCKRLCDCELNKWHSTFTEQIQDSDKYIMVDKELYELYDLIEEDPDECYCNIDKLGDNEYTFYTSFYNGGTCLTEMLEDAIKELNE